MSLPNIFKHFSHDNTKAETYVLPDITEAQQEEAKKPLFMDFTQEYPVDTVQTDDEESTQAERGETEPEREMTPIDYADIQAEAILKSAREEAEQILAQARESAEVEAELIRQNAREAGRQEGYREGVAQAIEEGRVRQEEQAALMVQEVEAFLEKANAALDRQLDENINELRDLAIAIAEKVICISLRSSTEIIGRMVQTALDKRRHREWVHIYISESDAKRMSQIPAALTAAVSGLSDRVRIISMADDDSGTLVIEMPDEIIDASASTQLSNIRSMLMNERQTDTEINSFGNFGF